MDHRVQCVVCNCMFLICFESLCILLDTFPCSPNVYFTFLLYLFIMCICKCCSHYHAVVFSCLNSHYSIRAFGDSSSSYAYKFDIPVLQNICSGEILNEYHKPFTIV